MEYSISRNEYVTVMTFDKSSLNGFGFAALAAASMCSFFFVPGVQTLLNGDI